MYTQDQIKNEYLKGKSLRYSETKSTEIYNFIERTVHLNITHKEKVYCFIHNIIPKCVYCGEITSLDNFKTGFKQYCSISCQVKDNKARCEKSKIQNIQEKTKNLSVEEIIKLLYHQELKIQNWRKIKKLENYKKFKTIKQLYEHVILKETKICEYCGKILNYDRNKKSRKCQCSTHYDRIFHRIKNFDNPEFLKELVQQNLYWSVAYFTLYSTKDIENEYYKRFKKRNFVKSFQEEIYCELHGINKKQNTEFINLKSGYKFEIDNSDSEIIKNKQPKEIKQYFIEKYKHRRFKYRIYQNFLNNLNGDNIQEKEHLIDHTKKYCEICGNSTSFRNGKYKKTCSIECANKYYALKRTQRAKHTFIGKKLPIILQKYNVELLTKYNFRFNEHEFKCKECGTIFSTNFDNGVICKTCNPLNTGISNQEKEVLEFIKSIYLDTIIENYRKFGKEFDIYLPDKKIAIEYNGLYWHSSFYKDKNYHLEKTEIAEANDIQLIHIFSNEWIYKQEIIKSILRSKLGLIQNKIPARKCVIKEVNSKESNLFLEENHLQGKDNAKYRFGLYYKNELVQLITFKRSHRSKDKYLELKRSCSKLNTIIQGGFSKLVKYAKSELKEDFITFADRRFTYKENLYSNFKFLGNTKPNYFYIIGTELESREKYQKHKLINILTEYNSELTEKENMELNGYFQIYDSGNYKYLCTV